MSSYNVKSTEEMRRRNNISHFLEGLLDEDDLRSDEPTNYTAQKEQHRRKKLATIPEPISVRSECIQAQYLPDCELRALMKHPKLFESNRDSILRIPFFIDSIKHSDELVEIYTGIPLVKGFFKIANMFPMNEVTYRKGWVVGQLTVEQQLLLTLMKLKLGMSDIDLSHRFMCSLETVINTVETWIFTIHGKLFDVAVGMVRRIRASAKAKKPLILHTFTVYQNVPKNPSIPHKTPLEPYTAVLLTKSDGVVIYASSLHTWTGRKKDAILQCGVLDVLLPGEYVVIDSDVRSSIVTPHTVSAQQIDTNNFQLVATRIGLEKRLKKYEALRCIPPGLEEHASVVWQTVVTLVNFSKFKPFMY